ncbi:MAG: hypothetical protein PHY87_09555, partial [Sphaerochaeta sp.]|nr:hypothetical protein [Sphaerochaeta sp.]
KNKILESCSYFLADKSLTLMQKVLILHNFGNSCIKQILGIVSEMLYDPRLTPPISPYNKNLIRGNA